MPTWEGDLLAHFILILKFGRKSKGLRTHAFGVTGQVSGPLKAIFLFSPFWQLVLLSYVVQLHPTIPQKLL
jgi:hypothetical protein